MDSKIKRNRIIAIIVIVVMVLAMAGTFFLSASRMKSRGFNGQFNGQKPDFSQEIEDGDFQPPTQPDGNSSSDSTSASDNPDSANNVQPPSMPDNENFKASGGGISGIIFNVCYAVEGILLGMAVMYLIMTRDKSKEEDEDDYEEDVLHC